MWLHSGFRDGETIWTIWMGPECHHNFFLSRRQGEILYREMMIGQSQQKEIEDAML